jgi:RNA polymerase sigma-70 factor, ECF subfamily
MLRVISVLTYERTARLDHYPFHDPNAELVRIRFMYVSTEHPPAGPPLWPRAALVRPWMTHDREPPSHESLIVAIAQRRDRTAFTTLFAHLAPRVKAYLQKSGMDAGSAEDMMQDVMLAVWHKAAQFDPARASAPAWIFGIARNLRIDAKRRSRLVLPMADPSEEAPPVPASDALVAAEQSAQALRRAVDGLPTDQMQILRLAFFEDLSHGEIERRLAVPLGTIKSRLRLAMSRLRLALKDEA